MGGKNLSTPQQNKRQINDTKQGVQVWHIQKGVN